MCPSRFKKRLSDGLGHNCCFLDYRMLGQAMLCLFCKCCGGQAAQWYTAASGGCNVTCNSHQKCVESPTTLFILEYEKNGIIHAAPTIFFQVCMTV